MTDGVRERRPFKVELTVFETHEYEVDARTAEEAISIANQYYQDGEEGTITSSAIDLEDAWPVDGDGRLEEEEAE